MIEETQKFKIKIKIKIKMKIKIIVLSLLFFCNWPVNSQVSTEVIFYGTKEKVQFTKSFMHSYDMYLVIDSKSYSMILTDSNYLVIPDMTIDKLGLIEEKLDVKVKFVNDNNCFFAILPNGFVNDRNIRSLSIYPTHVRKRFFNLFSIRWYSRTYSLNYQMVPREPGRRPANVPLTMRTCENYEGEFENGLESYWEWRKNTSKYKP